METVTLTKIDYSELEQIINEIFPKADYNFSADIEANNDNVYEFADITKGAFEETLNKESQYELRNFLLVINGDKKGIQVTTTMLEYLVWLEILPESDYLIEMSY